MIKDFTYVISNEDSVQSQLITNKINGKLVALLIKSTSLYYNIFIYLKEYPNIVLFNEKSVRHDNLYILLKNDSYNVNKLKYEYPDYWMLNDELVIELMGMKNTKIEVKFRVDE